MPSTVPPAAAIRLWVRSSNGISPLHGGHHDAQALSSTGLPRYWAREPLPVPFRRGSVATGAATVLPSEIAWSIEVSDPLATSPYASRPISAAAAIVTGQ